MASNQLVHKLLKNVASINMPRAVTGKFGAQELDARAKTLSWNGFPGSIPGMQEDLTEPHSGLRAVAIFEALKGVLVLTVGVGLLNLMPKDLDFISENIITFLHLNPAHHYPQVFLMAVADVTDNNILWLAIGAMIYSLLRLTEAFGLWHERVWAEWLAIISCGIFLPVEFYELARGFSGIKALITLFNIALVLYLLKTRYREKHRTPY